MHTHSSSLFSGGRYSVVDIISTTPSDYNARECACSGSWLSCGIHPWYITDSATQIQQLEAILSNDKQVIAVGEIGLDKIRGVPLTLQLDVFEQQVELAIQYSKPIIIHCVKCWDELIAVKRNSLANNSWIIHGFRGNEQQMKQLYNMGFSFSIGCLFNERAVKELSIESLYCETDDNYIPILDVYTKVAQAKGIELECLINAIESNIKKTFFGK